MSLASGYAAFALQQRFLREGPSARETDDNAAAAGTPPPKNPQLKALLDQHPEIKTNQDLLNYFWKTGGGWSGVTAGAKQYGLTTAQLTNFRTANVWENVYPLPPPNGLLPSDIRSADRFHIVQYAGTKYNTDPNAPSASSNCGPASLAMALDVLGKMPQGLTGEQKIDYARSLMYPKLTPTSYVELNGRQIPQLSQDKVLTSPGAVETGAEALGATGTQATGWAALDAALQAGQPAVAFGGIDATWRKQFPYTKTGDAYQPSSDVGHFVTVMGRTADGKYIVSDPMYTGGPVTMTREQLAELFPNLDPTFVAISK